MKFRLSKRFARAPKGHVHWRIHVSRYIGLIALLFTVLPSVTILASANALAASLAPAAVTNDDWPTYMHDVLRTGGSNDTGLSVANAAQLTKQWAYKTNGGIAAQAAIVNGTAYIGSWDGYEYAIDVATGNLKWKTNLGQTVAPNCIPATIGVTSSATVYNGVVYVGGGDAFWYALDANTGNVLWKINTGDNSAEGGHYNWSSPLIYNGSAYIGIASNCDEPLVQGLLWKVDLTTHQVTKVFEAVPQGQVGGGIWTTPAVDAASNTIYFTTGTQSLTTQTYSQAIVALDATTLAVKGSWQIPFDQAGIDLDWGTSAIVFNDANGNKRVSAINKDGFVYSFDAANLNAGPIWQKEIAETGSCPPCGNGSVSTSAFGNGAIYVAGGNTSVNGAGYQGSIRALDATTGDFKWERGVSSPVIPAVTYANGLVMIGAGPMFEVLNATNGDVLYSFKTTGMYAPAAVANGTIIASGLDGTIYAFGAGNPTLPPNDANCPAGWTCQDLGGSTPAGTENTGGNWNVTAGGAGLAGTADQARFISKNVNGDTQITAQVQALPGGTAGAQAGLMVRQSNDPGSPYYTVFATANNTVTVQYRAGFAAATTVAKQYNTAAKYLRLLRKGDQLQAATSPDGVNYTLVPGGTTNLVVPTQAMVGVVTSSGVNGTAGIAQYANVAIAAAGNVPPSPPPATACPNGWNCADLGNPSLVGDQTLDNAGVWTLKGAGQDIANFNDQFHFVWQPLAANGTVSARITAQTNTSPGAKAGVMLRQGTDSAAPYYAAFLTPGKGVVVQYRSLQGRQTTQVTTTTANQAPVYLRVERYTDANNGTVFATYTSTDGTAWIYIEGTTATLDITGALVAGIAVSSANAGTMGNATFDHVNVSTDAPLPPTLCPDGWTCADIANSVPTGNQEVSNGTWKVQAGGSDIWSLGDQFRFMWQTVKADASVSARVVSQTNTDPWAKGGVMLRQAAKASAPYYAAFVTPTNGISIQYRLVQGGDTRQITTTGKAPTYLQVARSGNIYTTYTSDDGVTWTPVTGSSITMNILGDMLAGLAVTSHTTAALTTVVFDHVTVANTAPIPPTACPTGWNCTDIGNSTLLGAQSLSNNTWNIQGGGTDIWHLTDQFHYVWQNASGDVTVSAHITSQTNTDPWAKAGPMLRLTTDPDSAYYAVFVTPDNGIGVQFRPTKGGDTTQISIGGKVPTYLRVARSSGTFTAYTSTDGTTWTPIPGSTLRLKITADMLAGIAVTSHSDVALSTINLDGFTIGNTAPVPPAPVCPNGWSCADIGEPTLVGDQTLNNGTWTVKGGGTDIWDVADQFHYVWQTLAGDGALSAHVTAQTNTDPWAKSGVMLRQSTDAGSPYYAAFITPTNGVSIQYRLTQSGATTQLSVNGTVPIYLKVVRTGTNYAAYTSANGTNWTVVANSGVTINTTGGMLAGLVVNSHNAGYMGSATFDTVNIAAGTQALAKPAKSTCPVGWSCGSLGKQTPVGNLSVENGTWKIQDQSDDIQGTSDQFHYAWQTLKADGSISARVVAQDNTELTAKAGVMVRENTRDDSAYYGVFVTPGNGIVVQYRTGKGVRSVLASKVAGKVPVYLKVTRTGNTFSAYTSQDGKTWTLLAGSTTKLEIKGSLLAGLAVTSRNKTVQGTVTFDHLTLDQVALVK